jgi:thiol:disulfide interchange protein/DsbC/DsbD-like thiol-disulfide interchange protein
MKLDHISRIFPLLRCTPGLSASIFCAVVSLYLQITCMVEKYIIVRRRGINAILFSIVSSLCQILSPIRTTVAEPLVTPHGQFNVVISHQSVKPGNQIAVALHVALTSKWHIYWMNPGDSGATPSLSFDLPKGFSVEGPYWPSPEVLEAGPFVNYGYTGEIYLPYRLKVAPGVEPYQELKIGVHLSSVVCEEDCIPLEASFLVPLNVIGEGSETPTKWLQPIEEAFQKVPQEVHSFTGEAVLLEDSVELLFQPLHDKDTIRSALFIPATAQVIRPSKEQTLTKRGSKYLLITSRSLEGSDYPEKIPGILRLEGDRDGETFREDISVTFTSVSPESISHTGTPSSSASPLMVLSQLGFAFLAGLILNLMPCVFPVIGIKILNFMGKCGNEAKKTRLHGLAFSSGVLVSFWLLAGLMLAFRSAGEQIGWGFQLQSPTFVYIIIVVLVLWALNLFGLFEIGSTIQNVAGSIETKSTLSGSFLSGVLATFIATPCSAPFMGGAIALALTLPVIPAILIFTSLGLGMSTPYLLLSFIPSLLARLPRPGSWMVTFRQIMGFPLLLTVVWLLWIYGRQQGTDHLIVVLFSLIVTSFALFLGSHIRSWRSPSLRSVAKITIFLVTGVVLVLPLFWSTNSPSRGHVLAAQDGVRTVWERFSTKHLKKLLDESRPVFVDFTAAWCITCQVNKKLVLEQSSVRTAFHEAGVSLLVADWTNADAEISIALEQLGRNSVPVYALYRPGEKQPYLFPSLLTPDMIVTEVKKLHKDNG